MSPVRWVCEEYVTVRPRILPIPKRWVMSANGELAKTLAQGVQELNATMETLAKYEQERSR